MTLSRATANEAAYRKTLKRVSTLTLMIAYCAGLGTGLVIAMVIVAVS